MFDPSLGSTVCNLFMPASDICAECTIGLLEEGPPRRGRQKQQQKLPQVACPRKPCPFPTKNAPLVTAVDGDLCRSLPSSAHRLTLELAIRADLLCERRRDSPHGRAQAWRVTDASFVALMVRILDVQYLAPRCEYRCLGFSSLVPYEGVSIAAVA